MSSSYQVRITDFYNVRIGNVRKLVPNFFDKERYVLHYENLLLYLRLGSKLKTMYRVLVQKIITNFSRNLFICR